MTTIGTESPKAWATPPNEFSAPGPCCIAKTPMRSPEVTRLRASAMCRPTRSWRTMIVRMSASAAATDLIRALQGREFTEAFAAAERLADFAAQRAQVVPALIDAVRNREWASCSGDVRDAAARSLAQLKAKEAVVPLLELVKSGR